ncbi:response regulator transcription factor [Solidesulfovibrio magneticus]|uniref:Transcriptional regulatory protein CpxR n=1 Tax=Solidesulfovibrio magneticus (strain ATCC 700980 / DSM 13731 / RS-1) TaxID=573370 RepID=C4XTY1_SOLM1|nr:response regulator transcription factor [Solidesulfovibrio magneticus]BAH73646.1 transcriptional regulatory protein CpxR [Solidesulfovibrio magneticus RS-1]
MNSLLLIDDDMELCELLGDYLHGEGFDTESVHNPMVGVTRAVSGQHDLVVLDVMMPELNGFEVLRRIRAASQIPVLMLTARGEDVDRIVGLEIGADDYLPKPFNSRELVARIRAILRRTETGEPTPSKAGESISISDVVINVGGRSVLCNGKPLDLTSIEYSILEVLMRMAGKVVSREELAEKAMGRKHSAYERSLDVHICSLRKKLGTHSLYGERIKTVRNMGYLYVLST